MRKLFTFLFGLIFLFVALGELGRLPIGPEILPNDLLIAGTIGVFVIYKIFIDRHWPYSALLLPFLIFIAIAFISLINGARALSFGETLGSSLYLIRFIEYFFLFFMALDLSSHVPTRRKLTNIIFGAAFLIAIFGFIQLKIYPDFTQMALEEGWDPHQNRLLSTWFDPNFVGGMLAFVSCLAIGKLTNRQKWPKKIPLAGLLAILLMALAFTYSRSAYLALIAGVGLIGLLKSRKLLLIGFIACLLLVSVSSRAQDRVEDLYFSAKSFVTETYELPDASARLRLDSWGNALTIFKDHPLLGVGYNTYANAQARYGFMTEDTHHAATGSDSTILTILATTGILGAATYLWLIVTILWTSFHKRREPLALGFFCGFCGLLIHSVFVNSLLYAPILIFIYTALGIILAPKLHKS